MCIFVSVSVHVPDCVLSDCLTNRADTCCMGNWVCVCVDRVRHLDLYFYILSLQMSAC